MAIDGLPGYAYYNGVYYNNLVLACAVTAPNGYWDALDELVLKVICAANLTAFQLMPAWIKKRKSSSDPLNVTVFRNEAVVTTDGAFYVLKCTVGGTYYDYTSTYPYFAIYSTNPAEITGLELISFKDRNGNDKTSTIVFDYPGLATPLATPTGLNATNVTSDSARTNWQAVENASNYKVQYKAAGDTVWTETYTD